MTFAAEAEGDSCSEWNMLRFTTAAAANGYLIGRKCSSTPGCCKEKKKKQPSRTVTKQRGIMELPQPELLFIECLLCFTRITSFNTVLEGKYRSQ